MPSNIIGISSFQNDLLANNFSVKSEVVEGSHEI